MYFWMAVLKVIYSGENTELRWGVSSKLVGYTPSEVHGEAGKFSSRDFSHP